MNGETTKPHFTLSKNQCFSFLRFFPIGLSSQTDSPTLKEMILQIFSRSNSNWRLKSCIRQQWDIFPQPFIAFNILKLVFYKSSDLEKDDLVIVPSLRLRNLTEFFVCQWFASFAVDTRLSTFQ